MRASCSSDLRTDSAPAGFAPPERPGSMRRQAKQQKDGCKAVSFLCPASVFFCSVVFLLCHLLTNPEVSPSYALHAWSRWPFFCGGTPGTGRLVFLPAELHGPALPGFCDIFPCIMGRHGPVCHGSHHLAEYLRPHISDGIHARKTGPRGFIRDDITAPVQL